MLRTPRRSAMKVRDGRVQRKNRTARTPHYLTDEMPALVIDRKNPGPVSRHLISKDELRRFLEILPNWDELLQGLNAIVLDRGYSDCLGWHKPGVIGLCAWDRSIVFTNCAFDFIFDHREILNKLNVPYDCVEGGTIEFTEATARAFALIHVLVHELGHHHDRLTTRSRKDACRGEGYAEAYARRHEDEILTRYQRIFKL